MELFDREYEFGELSDALERASHRNGSVVALLGEAGVGKSSLARQFIETAEPKIRVLRGYCDDLGIAEPLGVLRDLARESEVELPDNLVAPGRRLQAFSKVFEGFLRSDTSTVIVVEDIHWADEATVDFLRFLTRRVTGARIMVILTARTDEATGRGNVRRIIGDAASGDVRRLELGPLSEETVTQLALEAGTDARQLRELTGGNAFYVTELLNSEVSHRSKSVEEAVLSRADRLDPKMREVLEAASIFPRQIDAGHLSTLINRHVDEALSAIEDQGFIARDSEGYAFRHVLVRQALRATVDPTRTIELNRRLLEVLKNEGSASPSRLLFHAREAEIEPDVRKYSILAAVDASKLEARREAHEYNCVAVESHGTEAAADLLEDAAYASHLVGADAESITFQSRALEIYKKDRDEKKYGNALRLRSRFHWSEGNFEASWADARAAVDRLSEIRGPELAMAHSNAAQVHMLNREYRQVREPAEAAIEIAEELGRSDILSHALNNLACALMFEDPDRSRSEMGRSLQLAMDIGHVEHTARAFVNATYIEMYLCQYDAAKAYATRGMFYCKSKELDAYLAYLTGALALSELGLGELSSAGQNASEAISLAKSFDLGVNRHSGSVAVLRHQIRTGTPPDPDEIAYLDGFRSDATEVQRLIPYAECIAEHAWMTGENLDRAFELLALSIDLAPTVEIAQTIYVWRQRLQPDAKIPIMGDFLDCYRLELQGDFVAANRAWEARSAPYEHALCLAHGDQKMRVRAAEQFDSLGASAAARRVRASILRTGAPKVSKPRASTLNNPAGLTKRQMDVLQCLQEGLSNAAIADRLFISAKTVDHHVSAILAKLDVQTRAEAAAMANQGKLDI